MMMVSNVLVLKSCQSYLGDTIVAMKMCGSLIPYCSYSVIRLHVCFAYSCYQFTSQHCGVIAENEQLYA